MKKYSIETAVGIFLVIGLLCIGYMTVTLGHVSFFGDNSYSLFARFTSVTGLRVGSLVYISGIEVGQGGTAYHRSEKPEGRGGNEDS